MKMADSADFAEARQLEDLKLSQDISDATAKREAQIQEAQRKLAAQGLLRSGARFTTEVNLLFESTQEIVDKAVARRKELGQRVPLLLTKPNLATLEAKLIQMIDGTVNGVKTRLTLHPRNAGGGSVLQRAEQLAYGMKAGLRNRLAAAPLEVKFDMGNTTGAPAQSINISNSTIGNLNLGTVMGDLNGSIQQLRQEGQVDLSDALEKLSEAIIGSAEVQDQVKKDLLEHVAFVSGEMALPGAKRKMGPVRSSIEALKSGLAVASELVSLWQGVEKALQMMGALPHS